MTDFSAWTQACQARMERVLGEWLPPVPRLRRNGCTKRCATRCLYFPIMDEMYLAQAGGGATLNGIPIHVQPPVKSRPAPFFGCCGNTHKTYDVRVPYKPRILGSAAYNFGAVARGAAVLGFEATPRIWDVAAAWLMVQEAGGVIEVYDGPAPFPHNPDIDYAKQVFPTLSAANHAMVAKGRDMIRPRQDDTRRGS